jgi:hypothetical protein
MLVTTKGEAAVTYHIAVSDTCQTPGNFEFVSCGDKHIRYWTLAGKSLTAAKVSTSEYKGPKGHEKCPPQGFLCVVLCNSQVGGGRSVSSDRNMLIVNHVRVVHDRG